MADSVIDATVVAFANGDIAARRPGNAFDRRMAVIEQVAYGHRRLRYNQRLLGEYEQLVHEYRNDVIDLFFTVLTETAIRVRTNTLSRQNYAQARRCRWPSHDQTSVNGKASSIVRLQLLLHIEPRGPTISAKTVGS